MSFGRKYPAHLDTIKSDLKQARQLLYGVVVKTQFSRRMSGQACPTRVGSHLILYIVVLLNPQTLERRIPGIGVKN